jgi:predicted metalloprotease with PDZ domain
VGRAAGGRDFAGFRTRYVDGREPLPFDSVLPLAGLRLQSDTARQARIGISTAPDSAGARVIEVVPGSMAAAAGVQPGDRLLSVGDLEIQDGDFGAEFRRLYSGREGEELELVVRRGEERLTLEGRVQLASIVTTRVAAAPSPDAKALRIHEGLLTGSVTR